MPLLSTPSVSSFSISLESRAQIDLTGEFSITNVELSKLCAAFSPSNSACASRFIKEGCGGEKVEIPAKKSPESRAQIDLTGEFSLTNVVLSKSWAAFSPSNSACASRFLKVGGGDKEGCGGEEVEISAKKRPKVLNHSV